ncbi:MAG: 1,4-dihydroxy-2-naphthoate polyprenyltransferase [Cyclobacteriaceae bacterium]|nr:1,4-dihydroxy-2-naphthoate polyprenyltransferase [Cyclobacteriaceae bacterium]
MKKAWIEAARPRTLPLALASILLGSFVAMEQNNFKIEVFILAALTTALLQILSNLANDYGDSKSGVDGEQREGPKRTVQSGTISAQQMKKAIYLFAILSFMSGLCLLIISLIQYPILLMAFLGLGLIAIFSAIAYTNGRRPYGYIGLGDLFVWIFFGPVAVYGVFFLYEPTWSPEVLLPASVMGLLSVGVLNVNNIRDIESDKVSGKKSIPVRIGREKALVYHAFLILMPFVLMAIYLYPLSESAWRYLPMLSFPLFAYHLGQVWNKKSAIALDPYLKQLALSTLTFVLLFGLGIYLQ